MDAILYSVDEEIEAVELRRSLAHLLSSAGFSVRKWCNNRIQVLKEIPVEDREAGVKIEESEIPNIKTLGLQWNASADQFGFTYATKTSEKPFTKRKLLSRIATLYDPLQFLAHFTIRAKTILLKTVDSWSWLG
ncbi:Uncharacterised protein r2_g2721 [Pycnogonum litorale]